MTNLPDLKYNGMAIDFCFFSATKSTDEIFMLFEYYARLYPEAAQPAIKNSQVSNKRRE
jgi:hypothetical protein